MNDVELEQGKWIKSWMTRESNEYDAKSNYYCKEAESNLKKLKQVQRRIKRKEALLKEHRDTISTLSLKEEKHEALQLSTKVRLICMQHEQMKRMRNLVSKWLYDEHRRTLSKMTAKEKRKMQQQEDLKIYLLAKRELQEYKARYEKALQLRPQKRAEAKATKEKNGASAKGDHYYSQKLKRSGNNRRGRKTQSFPGSTKIGQIRNGQDGAREIQPIKVKTSAESLPESPIDEGYTSQLLYADGYNHYDDTFTNILNNSGIIAAISHSRSYIGSPEGTSSGNVTGIPQILSEELPSQEQSKSNIQKAERIQDFRQSSLSFNEAGPSRINYKTKDNLQPKESTTQYLYLPSDEDQYQGPSQSHHRQSVIKENKTIEDSESVASVIIDNQEIQPRIVNESEAKQLFGKIDIEFSRSGSELIEFHPETLVYVDEDSRSDTDYSSVPEGTSSGDINGIPFITISEDLSPQTLLREQSSSVTDIPTQSSFSKEGPSRSLSPTKDYLQVPKESKRLHSSYYSDSNNVHQGPSQQNQRQITRLTSLITDSDRIEDSHLSNLVDMIIENQRKKAQDELDRLGAGDEDSVTMKSNDSVNRIASAMVNVVLCEQFHELELAKDIACGASTQEPPPGEASFSFGTPPITSHYIEKRQLPPPPLNAELSDAAHDPNKSVLSQIALLGLGAMSEGGSSSGATSNVATPTVDGRPGSFDAQTSPSGTIELLVRRDVSESVMDLKVEQSQFISQHVIPVESDASTAAGLHVHPEFAESHIRVLGNSISPSLANFDTKFGVTTASSDAPGPSRNIAQNPIFPRVQETSILSSGAGPPVITGPCRHVFSSTPEDVRKSVLEQLSSIREEVDALRREINNAGRGNLGQSSTQQPSPNVSNQRSQQRRPL